MTDINDLAARLDESDLRQREVLARQADLERRVAAIESGQAPVKDEAAPAAWRLDGDPRLGGSGLFHIHVREGTQKVADVYGPTAEECRARALSFIANNGPVTS